MTLEQTDPPQAQLGLIIQHYNSGKMIQAEQECSKLLPAFPRSFITYNLFGAIKIALYKPDEALHVFDEAIRINHDYADAHFNRGIALYALERLEDALKSYDKCIRLTPDHIGAHNNRSATLYELDRTEDAIQSYNKTIQLKPDHTEAHRNLSHLKKYTASDPQIQLMENLYLQQGRSERDRLQLCFALAKAYDDTGDTEISFRYLKEGNSLRKKELNYNIDNDINLMNRIKSIFHKGFPIITGEDSHEPNPIRPIFIVGMPRSGTSLVEQIIASHSAVHGAGEFSAIELLISSIPWQNIDTVAHRDKTAESHHETLRKGYIEAVAKLNVPESVITDKMPLNFRWIGFILSAFPDAKIINLNRDPIATCWSCYKHYFSINANGYVYDLEDLAEFHKLYIDLMSFWREQFPDNIYDICYEKLTENQEQETLNLLKFCNLDMEDQCLNFHDSERVVKTASTSQVRNKMYQGSSEAWRKYEYPLKSLIKALS